MIANDCLNSTAGFLSRQTTVKVNMQGMACNSNIKCLENAAAIRQKLGFQDESRQEEAIPKSFFVQKEVSYIKYTCPYKREGSDYFSKKVKTP